MALFQKTHIYTVHINPSWSHAVEKAVFIREGFNFMAFIFGTFWALYNRMWLEALFIAVPVVLLGATDKQDWLDDASLAVLNIAVSFVIGLWANDLRRAYLARRGYIMSGVVVSEGEMAAQQRYFEHVAAA